MDIVLSIIMLAALILLFAAVAAWRRGAKQQAMLMALLAIIGVVNVGIWTLPDEEGVAPSERLKAAKPLQ